MPCHGYTCASGEPLEAAHTPPQRSISRRKHDLHRRNAQSARFPANPVCGSRAQRLPGRAHVPMTGHGGHTRLRTRLYRSVEVAVLTFRAWHVCARCHRERKNLRATLRSGSELVSLSDRMLLLAACRPTCSCQTRLCRRHGQMGSSNRKARIALQSRWALLLTNRCMQMPPRATAQGYWRSYRSRRPAS